MVQITLTPEQSAQLREAESPVKFVDSGGRVLGNLVRQTGETDWSPEELKAAKAAAKNWTGGKTTAELLQSLQSLGSQ